MLYNGKKNIYIQYIYIIVMIFIIWKKNSFAFHVLHFKHKSIESVLLHGLFYLIVFWYIIGFFYYIN